MASPRGTERIDIADGGYIAWANPDQGGRIFEVVNRHRETSARLTWAQLRELHTALGPVAKGDKGIGHPAAVRFGGGCYIAWGDGDHTGRWFEFNGTSGDLIAVSLRWDELSDVHYALGVTLGRTQT
jgi:hypothetical protein